MKTFNGLLMAFAVVSFIGLGGCNEGGDIDGHAEHSDHGDHSEAAAHAHPTEGPHHGSLIELGNEEYHAELLHDKSDVTIYILDGAAKDTVAIDAKEVHVNLKHGNRPEQFTLRAAPQDGDGEGKSSCFKFSGSHLASHLDDAGSDARLSVVINGTPYSGSMSHTHGDHGHDHDHDHDDHEGHDHSHEHGEAAAGEQPKTDETDKH